MSAHKSIDRICIVIVAVTLVISVIFCNGQTLGIGKSAHAIGYENRIFDNSKVHKLDIVINDWNGFIEGCESEEYSPCNLVIDGEAVKNVGIRAKGNTSLSSVKNMDSSRYSFKIEFDQYENGKTYHGLDKLCLNNIIQDNTYMKDYIAYTLMHDFGVDAPLCSFVYITVNGDDWGLYLAVEAIEESFLERNYGSNYGDLYKPDAMGFGGGRGNGKDFSMSDFMDENSEDADSDDSSEKTEKNSSRRGFGGNRGGGMQGFRNGNMPGGFDPSQMTGEDFDPSQMFGGDFDPSQMFGGEIPDFSNGGMGGFGGGMPGGMGSDDVKLKYTDDDFDSYSNIFNNAKTTVNKSDKKRLIKALKSLSEKSDIENTVDVEEVIRYFVVHNFLCNGDSYTGQMIHNYYLYEKDGQLSMIPWDYNLAYGSFMGGQASSSINSPIDTPVSGGMSDRPMIAWIFSEGYTEKYHQLFSEFLESVDFEKLVDDTAALIDEYVEKDPTKFCTYEEFRKGVEAIREFCKLRAESVSGQLEGAIPSTTEGQSADSSAFIDTGDLNISDMGSMGGKGGGFGGGNMPGGFGGFGGFGGRSSDSSSDSESSASRSLGSRSNATVSALGNLQAPGGNGRPDFGGEMPSGFDSSKMPGGMGGFGGEMPSDFDPSNMPGGMGGFGGETTESTFSADKQSGGSSAEEKGTAPAGTEPSDKATSASRESRSRMGDFSPRGNVPDKSRETQYILLGISGLVLLAGLGFALKFKR